MVQMCNCVYMYMEVVVGVRQTRKQGNKLDPAALITTDAKPYLNEDFPCAIACCYGDYAGKLLWDMPALMVLVTGIQNRAVKL